ncbi:MAG: excinuclease ABC subunit UvrA [Deltaproteobacteria bacterium]
MSHSYIVVKGAKEHNLKNIHFKIPRDKFVVITGVSGSGKSSIAFDTLYAEGQRRYVESLSSYARQFLDQMKKPDVEAIEGLSATIAIEQASISRKPRSTVGTITEIYDYLRLLFARVGHPHCYQCQKQISSQSAPKIVESILRLPIGEKISILAPIVRGRKGEYQKELYDLRQGGFVRVKADGEIYDLSETISLDKNKKHHIDVYIDRLVLKEGIESRLSSSVEAALQLSDRLVKIERANGEEKLFSAQFACVDCELSFPELEPRLFSFNSPIGACPKCLGVGLASPFQPWKEATEETIDAYQEEPDEVKIFIEETPCPACGGKRLKPEALAVRIQARSISDICSLPLTEADHFFRSINFSTREKAIAEKILKEITERLTFLINVGVGYLTLDRRSSTVSGGEGRRIRLAAQIGSPLVGVLYILDEPSIGLHPRDNAKLVDSLKSLRDRGNTVLVVEHDAETILSADHIIDMGPGAGAAGGNIVAQGTLEQILKNEDSLTAAYLSHKNKIAVPKERKMPGDKFLEIIGATENNLKNISVKIPLGLFTCITGVSGSGKSSLIIDTLYPALLNHLHRLNHQVGNYENLVGVEQIDQVVDIDQSPIGRTPRSNPATYTGVFSHIRDFFAQLSDSKVRGYAGGRYSFNVPGGRCETCLGGGLVKMEMHFLPHMYILCDICQGQRYNRETLDVRYKEKNIAEILEMTVDEALLFFDRIPHIKRKLQSLSDVGMGYVRIGQQATTLSGGEAQRVKLAKELSRRTTGKTLFILDEPTTGLHFDDIHKLLKVLHQLVDLGNTVVVIEHNLEVIKTADHVIDLGPGGGEEGGRIVAEGTPEKIATIPSSFTGEYLKKALA